MKVKDFIIHESPDDPTVAEDMLFSTPIKLENATLVREFGKPKYELVNILK